MWRAGALLLLVGACGASAGIPDAPVFDAVVTLPDAVIPVPDAVIPDAAIADAVAALPDAVIPIPDAAARDAVIPVPDAAIPDAGPDLNPGRITLVDVSLDAVGVFLYGGSTNIDPWDVGSGAAIGDLDGDGRLDLVIARNDDPASTGAKHGGSPTILWNTTAPGGSPHFAVDDALSARFAGMRAHGAAIGDFDGDGDLDVFIAASGPDVLLRNDGGGVFTDVTLAAGVAGLDDDDTTGALWFDANGDGLLDLYVYSYTESQPPTPDARSRNRLYLNLGDGTFADVSAASGADSGGASQAAAAFSDDGSLVLYVANDRFCVEGMPGATPIAELPPDAWLTRASVDGEGVPHFVDDAVARGVVACRSSMGIGVADLDGDLRPDLYVTDIGAKSLYLSGTLSASATQPATALGIAAPTEPTGADYVTWGARFLDLDRDGLPELMLINGSLNRPFLCTDFHQLDLYFRVPAAGARFADVTGAVGLPTTLGCAFADFPIAGRGLVVGDLDGDGDDDLVIAPWNEPYRIYRNDTPRGGHYLRVRLHGTVSSPDPVGARLIVTRHDGTRAAAFRVAGGDTYSQSDSPLEFGLGADEAVTDLEIDWPSGLIQHLAAPELDRELRIDEPLWLALSARVAAATDPAPILVVDRDAQTVTATRSDGLPVTFTAMANGSFAAPLPHPGVTRRTTVTVTIDGIEQNPRPMVSYR